MNRLNLVIGANGHLGNNLLRRLLEKGEKTRASVRDLNCRKPFAGLECEVVYADLMDQDSLIKAMNGVEVVYAAAAVYKSWARDIQKEIIQVNIEGTKNLIEAAAKQGVKKIIYISTAHALDSSKVPLDETSWNHDYSDPYRYSKTEAEKAALNLAKQHNLWLVSILPTGMIGPNCYGKLTPTMESLAAILENNLPFDPLFNMNFIDIDDAAEAIITASDRGGNGERYLLGQENPISMGEVFELAHSLYPTIKIPFRSPYLLTYSLACVMESMSAVTKQPPVLLRSLVKTFYKADMRCDSSKAKSDLGFEPRPQRTALTDVFKYLTERKALS